ncbi:MAG: PAS domain-containing sensor histidine kinase [Solirubrobacteraceae bacterium]
MSTPGTEAARTFARGWGEDDRFFDLSLDLLTTVGFDGRFKRVNPSWGRTLGWTEAELLARPYLDVVHPDDRERMAAEAERLAREGSAIGYFEMRLIHRDGSHRWIAFSAATDAREELLYVVGREITGHKHAEAALRDSELRLRSVTDAVYDAVISADESGRIAYWSPGARRIFGYEDDEVLGQPLTMLMPEAYRPKHEAGLSRYLDGGEPRVMGNTVELDGRRKDGREFPLELSLGEAPLAGGRLFTGVIREIAVRRRAERYLTTQLAVASVMAEGIELEDARPRLLAAIGESMGWMLGELWRVDEDEGALACIEVWHAPGSAHPRFDALTRETRFERGVGLPGRVWQTAAPTWFADVRSHPDFPRSATAAAEGLHGAIGLPVLQAGRVVGVMDFYSGRVEQPEEELLTMMTTFGAQVGEYFVRKEAERALERTANELRRHAAGLERSNADLEQFAYVASHDLSEPLRTVSGFVGLLAKRYEGRLDPQADEYIRFAVEGVHHMRELIDDLLAYSRVGRTDQSLESVDIGALVAQVVRTLEPQIERAGGRVTVEPLPTVQGDDWQLRQVFQNLVANAIKFDGGRPPRVEVSAQREPGGWRFSVRDHGIGVDERHAQRIFKVFQRLHPRDEYEGTGIGLAICRRIVDRRGGRIWVRAAEGGGADFRFTVPDSVQALS